MKVMAQRPAMTLVLHASMRAVRRREEFCVQLGSGGGGVVEAWVGEDRGVACRERAIGAAFFLSVA